MLHCPPGNQRSDGASHNVESITEQPEEEQPMAAITALTRTAPDISCDHCANAITGALSAIEGVASVAVDVDHKRVQVEYDADSATPAAIDAALEEEGYPPL